MATENDLKQIHDKATRGVALARDELASLEAWYAQLDREEASALSGTPRSQTLTVLHAQIEAGTVQLQSATQQLQKMASENERLRREIADLQDLGLPR